MLGLQSYVAQMLKGILYTERNQQIMCEAGLPHELLSHGYVALADETHPLHSPLRAMFERLSAQSLTPRDLRYEMEYIHNRNMLISQMHSLQICRMVCYRAKLNTQVYQYCKDISYW